MKRVGFDAIADIRTRVLILGTMPSEKSIGVHEYYANPQNSFWWIMGQMVGATPDLSYRERLNKLIGRGVALWDVCHLAERPGSLDSAINQHTVVPNDFVSFLEMHPSIRLICFNGRPAEKIFRRRVSHLLPVGSTIQFQVLDSTSSAHARLRKEEKLLRWATSIGPHIETSAQAATRELRRL